MDFPNWHWYYWLIIASGCPIGIGVGLLLEKLVGKEE